MQTISFGLSAPAALDALVVSGDEILLGFVAIVLLGLSSSARVAVVGAAFGTLMLSFNVFGAELSGLHHAFLLSALVTLTGLNFMIQFVIKPIDDAQSAWPVRKYDSVLAGICALSVVMLLGIEAERELGAITDQYSSRLPLALGVLIALVNTLGFGGLILIIISWFVQSPRVAWGNKLKLTTGALLIALGVYCVGVSLEFDWPGDELIVVCIAVLLWLAAYGYRRPSRETTG